MFDDIENEYNMTLSRSRLDRLNDLLNYQLPTSFLYIASFFYPIVAPFLVIPALLFTPYLLNVLIREKKTGWAIGLIITSFLPVFLLVLLFGLSYYSTIVMAVFLALFYLFCLVLKMNTREWVADENARNELNYKRKLKKIEDDIFLNRFDSKNL